MRSLTVDSRFPKATVVGVTHIYGDSTNKTENQQILRVWNSNLYRQHKLSKNKCGKPNNLANPIIKHPKVFFLVEYTMTLFMTLSHV